MTEDLTYDFKYDNEYLSHFGFVVCRFNRSSELETYSGGAKVVFEKASMHGGKFHKLTSSKYEECITATFDICKDTCDITQAEMEISSDEYRDLARWLNRRSFHKFQIVNSDVWYNASFNLEKIYIDGTLYGIRLTMETDSPFGFGEDVAINIAANNSAVSHSVFDRNDEVGHSYPVFKITCGQAGNLTIFNDRDSHATVIKNCSTGEVINLDGKNQIITTSLSSHKIQNDFNFEFPTLVNSIDNRYTNYTFSLPCEVKITYTPIVKDIPNI